MELSEQAILTQKRRTVAASKAFKDGIFAITSCRAYCPVCKSAGLESWQTMWRIQLQSDQHLLLKDYRAGSVSLTRDTIETVSRCRSMLEGC
jgi:hypothetical protein